jgi:hypothetical protein
MSSTAADLEPKHACRVCGKPFDPEKNQEICDECLARRAVLWAIGLALLVSSLLALPKLLHFFGGAPLLP